MLKANSEPPAGLVEALRAFEHNALWAHANPHKLRRHVNRCVAVDKGRVVGVADDELSLRKRFANRKEVYFTFVWPEGLAWVL